MSSYKSGYVSWRGSGTPSGSPYSSFSTSSSSLSGGVSKLSPLKSVSSLTTSKPELNSAKESKQQAVPTIGGVTSRFLAARSTNKANTDAAPSQGNSSTNSVSSTKSSLSSSKNSLGSTASLTRENSSNSGFGHAGTGSGTTSMTSSIYASKVGSSNLSPMSTPSNSERGTTPTSATSYRSYLRPGSISSTVNNETSNLPSLPEPDKKIGISSIKNSNPSTGNNIGTTNIPNSFIHCPSTSRPEFKSMSATTSSLRATARFGLRSGTSHAHYNSSSLPGGNKINTTTGSGTVNSYCEKNNDEALIQRVREKVSQMTIKKNKDEPEPVTWMSRGTSPFPGSSVSDNPAKNAQSLISSDEIPSINPNLYDSVLVHKNKAVQTDKEQIPPKVPGPTTSKYLSSIPRPTPSSSTYFNTAITRLANNNSNTDSSIPQIPTTTNEKESSLANGNLNNQTSTPSNKLSGNVEAQDNSKTISHKDKDSSEQAQVTKRDPSRRPPTDPNKSAQTNPSTVSSTASVASLHHSRSINRIQPSPPIQQQPQPMTATTLKVKVFNKNVNSLAIRKSGSGSESESSAPLCQVPLQPCTKSGLTINKSVPNPKTRRGSITSTTSSCSSSRSNSVERSQSRSRAAGLDGASGKASGLPCPISVRENSPKPKQSSFLSRALAKDGEKISWIRRCESGSSKPWWLNSSADVTKGGKDTNPETDESNSDESDDDSSPAARPLEERTSPDGIEIPMAPSSPKRDQTKEVDITLLKDHMKQLFIGDVTNIDEVLGNRTDNKTDHPTAALIVTQTKKSQVNKITKSDKKNSSDESSSDGEDDDDSSSDDDASTGTSSSFEEVDPSSVKIHSKLATHPPRTTTTTTSTTTKTTTANTTSLHHRQQLPTSTSLTSSTAGTCSTSGGAAMIPLPQNLKLDDATLQLYKEGDYGTYLDLEASISEQQEDFEGFLSNRKNSIVLRAQLPVRVHAIIEKLLTADGRELRRALFSLKQIFQEDKDLVHEFVENGGLSCLIKVGSEADQNYQNYILRAIGQVMLYVDGMYGVMRHNETIQWLYSLVASKFRLVQKTALKLLLVFVDYVESNCLLLVEAVTSVDSPKGLPCWSNIMNLLQEHDSGDTELLVYTMSLINKVLNGIPDIDTYYDQVDALEEQGMATIVQKYMGKQCADLDLLQQLQIYEVVLKHEDGEENIMMQLDESMRQKLMNRKGYIEIDGGNKERRKSRRHSANGQSLTPPLTPSGNNGTTFPHPITRRLSATDETRRDSDEWSSSVSSSHSCSPAPTTGPVSSSPIILNGFTIDNSNNDVGVTPALRRRRERAERQKSLLREQQEINGHDTMTLNSLDSTTNTTEDLMSPTNLSPAISLIPLGRSPSNKRDVHNLVNGNSSPETNIKARPWMLPLKINSEIKDVGVLSPPISESEINLKRENTVKDLTQKLASQNLVTSPQDDSKSSRIGDLSGVISKAKEGLAKSKSKADIKPKSEETNGLSTQKSGHEIQKSDNELHWDFLVSNLNRPLEICDLDFTELKSEDDIDIITPHQLCSISMNGNSEPRPPLMMMNGLSPGPPPPPPAGGIGKFSTPPAPIMNGKVPPAPVFGISLKNPLSPLSSEVTVLKNNCKKTKKTVKLFWKEVREDPFTATKIEKIGCIWDEIQPVPLDTQKLEHLFESRAKDVIHKKQQEVNKFKEIVVLDPKRSNAINIGMTKLPPPRTIKTAIMKMDATIINREGIEKLLAMLPTDEERAKIQEAQFANPETPLGSAEHFLLTLASISELNARLKLWSFKLDYENLEKEIAEPLMDLKQGIEALQKNKTFRCILTTLLCIGNFLNGIEAKGFQIEYLAKVPEVKDTVHKHSLLHHLCQTVNEKFPESTDLYSEIGPVTRSSRVDFDELGSNLLKLETDCKASWDHLRLIAKHDGPTNMKLKMSEFLADCAERIIVLGIIHRRVMNRFHKFLLWLGVSAHQVPTTKPHILFKIVSEFALEYRTTRERVIQQLQKKANHRERNKTRGKMITEQIMHKTKEDKADADLLEVLKTNSDISNGDTGRSGSLTWTRRTKTPISNNNTIMQNNFNNKCFTLNGHGNLGDGDDEILESLVKTATSTPATRAAPRERKRSSSRYTDRKSLRRTLRHGLSEEERKLLAAFMANGHSF